jgi:hypothetical protein
MIASRRRRIVLAAPLLILAACGGSGGSSHPKSAAVDRSAVGAGKCQSDGDEHRLFLVEWDATDLSSFEAKAARDVVLVRYEGCKMRILHGCSDDGIAGKYGSYRAPEMTSGNVEGLSVKTEDELYAKLPLGAATFGAELSRGKALDLKYFVAGTAGSTRDSIYRGDIEANARCSGATHFVSAYNLGAFTLSSLDAEKVGAGASVAGVGAGAKHSDETAAMKKGGDLAACSSFDQHACKVPIRVVLRPISNGARPTAEQTIAAAAAGPPADTSGTLATANAMMEGAQLRMSAEQKLMAGDADGCLKDLGRAGGAKSDPQVGMLRGKCEMRSGKCDEGKKHYREAKAAWTRQFDKSGLANDASLDAEAETMARQFCPSAAAGGVSAQMGSIQLLQKIMQAQMSKDTAACIKHGDELGKLVASSGDADPTVKQAAGGLRAAAMCAGDGGKCADAKRLWTGFSKGFFGKDVAASMIDSGFKENVKACAGK